LDVDYDSNADMEVSGRTITIGGDRFNYKWSTKEPKVEGASCTFETREFIIEDFALRSVYGRNTTFEHPFKKVTKLKLTPSKKGVEFALESSDWKSSTCSVSKDVKPGDPDAENCKDGHIAGKLLTKFTGYFKSLDGSFWTQDEPAPKAAGRGEGGDKPGKSDKGDDKKTEVCKADCLSENTRCFGKCKGDECSKLEDSECLANYNSCLARCE
jgi:hypothetical protein